MGELYSELMMGKKPEFVFWKRNHLESWLRDTTTGKEIVSALRAEWEYEASRVNPIAVLLYQDGGVEIFGDRKRTAVYGLSVPSGGTLEDSLAALEFAKGRLPAIAKLLEAPALWMGRGGVTWEELAKNECDIQWLTSLERSATTTRGGNGSSPRGTGAKCAK